MTAAVKAPGRKAPAKRKSPVKAVPAFVEPAKKKRPASKPAAKAVPAVDLPPGRHPDFDLPQAIEAMPDHFIQCRDFSHSWRPHDARYVPDERCYEQIIRCSRCKTTRARLIDTDGQLVSNSYDYADGYLQKGMGRLTPADRDSLRLASVTRMVDSYAAK